MKKLTLVAASLCAAIATTSHANNLAIDIGNDSFAAELVSTNFSQNSQFALGMISAEDDNNIYSFKGLVTGKVQNNQNLTAAMGAKVYFIDTKSDNVQGLALGGEANYQVPTNTAVNFNIAGYVAPSPTLTDDLDYLTDLTITASYKVLPNGQVYINYRNLKAKHEVTGSYKINDGFNIGLNLSF